MPVVAHQANTTPDDARDPLKILSCSGSLDCVFKLSWKVYFKTKNPWASLRVEFSKYLFNSFNFVEKHLDLYREKGGTHLSNTPSIVRVFRAVAQHRVRPG